MNADDFSDYLKRVKAAEDIGLTSAEVWRGDHEHIWKMYDPTHDGRHVTDVCAVEGCNAVRGLPWKSPLKVDARDEEANSRCKRCRKAIDYQAQYCYDCTAAIWPGEME